VVFSAYPQRKEETTMTTAKNGKKVSVNRAILCILMISVWILMSAAPVKAETLKCTLVSGMTKVETLKVDDQEGHIVGVYERKGVMVHENGEIANELNRGVFDSVKGVNKWQGYCVQTFKDGSTMWMKHQGTGEKGQIVEATFELIKGTGRFEGIKGQGTFTGGRVAFSKDHGGFNHLHFTGTYTLPKK
jgi:hypothetical protein